MSSAECWIAEPARAYAPCVIDRRQLASPTRNRYAAIDHLEADATPSYPCRRPKREPWRRRTRGATGGGAAVCSEPAALLVTCASCPRRRARLGLSLEARAAGNACPALDGRAFLRETLGRFRRRASVSATWSLTSSSVRSRAGSMPGHVEPERSRRRLAASSVASLSTLGAKRRDRARTDRRPAGRPGRARASTRDRSVMTLQLQRLLAASPSGLAAVALVLDLVAQIPELSSRARGCGDLLLHPRRDFSRRASPARASILTTRNKHGAETAP